MHLPQIHRERFSVDYTRDTVDVGDCLYFAPDGTVMAVTNVSRHLIAFQDLSDNSTWTTKRDEVTDALYTDFFPVH